MRNKKNSLLGILLSAAGLLAAQPFTFTPAHPAPGDSIQIVYRPAGTPLEGAEGIEATSYLLEGELPAPNPVVFSREGDRYRAVLATTEATLALFVTFYSGEAYDTNDGKGYPVILYDTTCRKPVPGAMAATGNAYATFAGLMGLDRDPEQGFHFLRQEFAVHPESKDNIQEYAGYARLARQLDDEAALDEVRAHLTRLATRPEAAEAELMAAHTLAAALQDEEQAGLLEASIRERFPRGELVRQEVRNQFFRAYSPDRKEELYRSYEALVLEDSTDQWLSRMATILAHTYGSSDWEKFEYYAARSDDKAGLAAAYNDLAWELAGSGLDGQPGDLDKAERLSRQALELAAAIRKDTAARPLYLTAEEWHNRMDFTYGIYADTYALIKYRQGDLAEALKYQQICCQIKDFSKGEANERYAAYFEQVKGPEATITMLEDLIRRNKATSTMKAQYQRLFAATYSPEQAAARLLGWLEEEALNEYRKEIEKAMIDEPAPDFALRDLAGSVVSLASLQGKTVVLDFWATWCGPCKASFPAMQRAVDRYRDDDKVAFLFIDTWERVDSTEQNAADFLAEHELSFHVLMDNDGKVVADYQVDAIPTKIVIDPQGRIRFKTVGFPGDPDRLVKELEVMIGLATTRSASILSATHP